MTLYTATCDTCGRPFQSKHAKRVETAMRKHSCELWTAKQEAAIRRQAREAAVDRTPQPCLHKNTTHQHGTHACYVLDKCRCNHCSTANTAYEHNRARLHAYGRFNHLVDADPIRQHIEALKKQGLGLKRIGQLAGVSQSSLGKIIYGDPVHGRQPSRRVHINNARKILAVQANIDTLADGATLDGTGTRRRLQALMAIGWSQSKLARHMGYEIRNFALLVNGERGVTAKTARTVRALYDQLWNQQPPQGTRWERSAYTRTIRYAQQREWLPPMAWDDDSIDDGSTRPWDWQEPAKKVGRGRPAEDVIEDIEFLLEHDPMLTAAQIGERLGVWRDAIQAACRRTDPPRHDLLEQLARNASLERHGTAA